MTVHAAEENVLYFTKGAGEAGGVVVPFPGGKGGVPVLAEELDQKGVARIQCSYRLGDVHIVASRSAEDMCAGVNAGPGRHTDGAAQPPHVAVLAE